MPITDWPVEELPLEKLLAHGPAATSDAELLAIFLRTGVKGKTAVDLARELLTEFGGLRALLDADPNAFYQTKGLGTAKYVQLQAVLEMSRRYLAAGLLRGEAVTDPQAMRDYVRLRLQGYAREVFACLFLDSVHPETARF